MSHTDYCAFCYLDWQDKSLEDRKRTVPNRARKTVNGTRVCHLRECHDRAMARPA